MTLKDLQPRSRDIVKKLLKKQFDTELVKDVLKGKAGFYTDSRAGSSLVDHFAAIAWDNLSPEQQIQVIEATNKVLEEDLFKEKPARGAPEWEPAIDSYWDNLIEFACMLEGKIPSLIKKELLLKYRDDGFPNHCTKEARRPVNERIESAFLPKVSLKRRLDISANSTTALGAKHLIDGKPVTMWEYTWHSLKKVIDPKKLKKFTTTFNNILEVGVTQDIIHKENYIHNLLESCCYIEKYAPGYIDKEKVLKWYKSGYSGINFDDTTKNKLNKLIEENFPT